MKKAIIHALIKYCSRQAVKYDAAAKTLLDSENSNDCIYAIGLNIITKERYLKKIEKLLTYIKYGKEKKR